jgi:hypothetical protein
MKSQLTFVLMKIGGDVVVKRMARVARSPILAGFLDDLIDLTTTYLDE